jgi:polyferredoxin
MRKLCDVPVSRTTRPARGAAKRAIGTIIILTVFVAVASGAAWGIERFPAPDFKSGYTLPKTEVSAPAPMWRGVMDMGVLVGAMGVAAWLVFKKRSRRGVFILTIFSLLYFGFYRKGCICPIGSIQNVALAAGANGYALPLGVAVFFVTPLLFTLFYGRVFCAAVCPLGAIQDVVLWKPIHVPPWLEHALGLFAYAYLGLAVMFAAIGSDFIICRYDPFVGFFRLSAAAHMLFLGAVLLGLSMFVGRTYCRFICPYGVILRLLSIFSTRRVTITPTDCVDCRLCEISCPFGAIRYPTQRDPGRKRDNGRKQLVMALAALPALMVVFAGIGYAARGPMSRLDREVQLAERIWQEERGTAVDKSDPSRAFRGTGEPVEQLYARANKIRGRYAIGSGLFGAWMGLVFGGKWIGLVIRRQRNGYSTEPGGCVACARCYQSCPVEIEKKQQLAAQVVA